MTKTYVLDTNILIQSPLALLSFEDNKVVLPIAILEELDKLKNEEGERGANARQTIRYLEQLRQTGNLFEGVTLETGGFLKIETNFVQIELPHGFGPDVNDNRILKICKGLAEKGESVVLVTKDILVRLKSQKIGINAEDFMTEQSPQLQKQYTGRLEVYAPDNAMNDFKKKGILPEQVYPYTADASKIPDSLSDAIKREIHPVCNQFFIIHSETNEKKTLLGRFNGKLIVPLKSLKEEPFGVQPRNVGQKFLQEALSMDADTAPLVIVKGAAGTAKTFYSLAVGLEKIFEAEKKSYRKILITRPNIQFDDDIGFLPGTEQEKIAPYLRPIIDNLEILVDRNENERYQNEKELRGKIDEFHQGAFHHLYLSYYR